jgi:DNA-binding transcriptional regulator YdaS (Cro superfamily)
MEQNAISKAADIAGGQSALARILGCTPQAVQRMCASGRVSAERVLQIEKATGVKRYELRPDLYPVPRKKKAVQVVEQGSGAALHCFASERRA